MANKDISFATFNLYNLQLPGKPWRKKVFTQEEYDAKIQWSAAALRELDADVIAFQEPWSKGGLEDLFTAAGLVEQYEMIFIKDDWYDIAVAAAVRKPWTLADKALHKDFLAECVLKKRKVVPPADGTYVDREDDEVDVKIDRFSRTVLELELGHESGELPNVRVFCAHLKSKLATQLDKPESSDAAIEVHSGSLGAAISTIRRTAEAAALRVLLTKATKNTDVPWCASAI